MTGDGAVRFTMKLEAAVSTLQPTALGVYKVAADGTISDADIVFSNTLNVSAWRRSIVSLARRETTCASASS